MTSSRSVEAHWRRLRPAGALDKLCHQLLWLAVRLRGRCPCGLGRRGRIVVGSEIESIKPDPLGPGREAWRTGWYPRGGSIARGVSPAEERNAVGEGPAGRDRARPAPTPAFTAGEQWSRNITGGEVIRARPESTSGLGIAVLSVRQVRSDLRQSSENPPGGRGTPPRGNRE